MFVVFDVAVVLPLHCVQILVLAASLFCCNISEIGVGVMLAVVGVTEVLFVLVVKRCEFVAFVVAVEFMWSLAEIVLSVSLVIPVVVFVVCGILAVICGVLLAAEPTVELVVLVVGDCVFSVFDVPVVLS